MQVYIHTDLILNRIGYVLVVFPPPSCLPCSKLKRLASLFVYTLGHVLHFYFLSIMGNFLGRGAAFFEAVVRAFVGSQKACFRKKVLSSFLFCRKKLSYEAVVRSCRTKSIDFYDTFRTTASYDSFVRQLRTTKQKRR